MRLAFIPKDNGGYPRCRGCGRRIVRRNVDGSWRCGDCLPGRPLPFPAPLTMAQKIMAMLEVS